MIGLLFIFAILLIALWVRGNQTSIGLRSLRKRYEMLEARVAELTAVMQEARRAPATETSRAPETDIPEPTPAPAPAPTAIERVVPVAAPPISEPAAVPPPAEPIVEPPQANPPEQPAEPEFMESVRGPASKGWTLPQFEWESLVGVKLFSWVAGVALLLAAIFFLRYSINQGWLIPKVRMAIGLFTGAGLLALCELKAARKYRVTANAMDASAIAILFSTFYAARALWDLIGAVPAFLFMVLVTAVAVMLSIRRDSPFIALLGLLGGFATPALLSTGENRPISLFAYLLLLNAGLAYVAARKNWPLLTTLSLVFTVIYQWGWVIKFLTASQLPVAFGIFLVFPVLAFAMTGIRKEVPGKSWISLYGQTANVTTLLPVLFTLYLASVPAYGRRYILLFSFLFLVAAGLFAIAAARRQEILHFIGGLSTILVFAIWLWLSYSGDAWPAILAFIALFVIFYLAAPLVAERFSRRFSETGKWAAYAAPLLLLAMPALIALEPACENPWPLFGVLFLLLLGASSYAMYAGEGPVYYIAALFALAAEAAWAYRYLNAEHLYSGLALFGIYGLFFIGTPALARRWRKVLRPEGAGAGLVLISVALLIFLAAGQIAQAAIWGLALLLLILNSGLFWHGAACRLPGIAIAGMVLSWILLGVLWASVPLDIMLIPALVVMAGFAVLVLGGNIWLKNQAPESALPSNGILLGLTGHFFLAVIAGRSDLSIPPWPFLCVLLTLDLALGLSSLYLRRTDLHNGAMAASALLLMIWVATVKVAPWPQVAIFSAGVLSIFSLAWIYLAGRAGIDRSRFSKTAATTLMLSQVVAIVAAAQPGVPSVRFLLGTHVALLVALLALARSSGAHEYSVFAVIPTTVAVTLWHLQHGGPERWQAFLLFSAAIYLVYLAYPLLLGRGAGRSLWPCLAAVLASVPFFFQARHAMLQAGWGHVIGILPVIQAMLMGLLVMLLLRIEPPGERAQGRLALVAGAALAFVTVAIPLQLEKEWITIGWVLEGAALAWLYNKIPHTGLLLASTGLFAAVFVRLAFNPFVLTYEPRRGIRIWNWYLYTYLISSSAMILGGRLLSRTRDTLLPGWPRISKLAPAGGIVLLFLLLNIEIADYFSTGPMITFNFTATLAQDLTYTLAWAMFAVALLAVGIAIRSQPARIASLALLIVTIFKCFVHDLARLGELYRVMSFVGLGICLALVALALQKYVFSARNKQQN